MRAARKLHWQKFQKQAYSHLDAEGRAGEEFLWLVVGAATYARCNLMPMQSFSRRTFLSTSCSNFFTISISPADIDSITSPDATIDTWSAGSPCRRLPSRDGDRSNYKPFRDASFLLLRDSEALPLAHSARVCLRPLKAASEHLAQPFLWLLVPLARLSTSKRGTEAQRLRRLSKGNNRIDE